MLAFTILSLVQTAATFVAFHARFVPLFGRREAHRRSEQHVRGLLDQQPDHRNAENLGYVRSSANRSASNRAATVS